MRYLAVKIKTTWNFRK